MDVELTADGVPSDQLDDVRRSLASLEKVIDQPLVSVRVTLRGGPNARAPVVADAHLPFKGRVLAAHAPGRSPVEAADAVVERLRRQLRRIVDAKVATRNDPRAVQAGDDALRPARLSEEIRRKPPEERQIVDHRTYAPEPEPTLTAIADMLDDDELFHLFVHARTGEDVVVCWLDSGRIGLIFPPGSILADEGDLVVPRPSRYSEPLPLATARAEMDMLDHRFLYFVDAADARGKVLYLRFDGDYGLVVPA
jgi:ribosome-associated translation inhibitor RaiA